MWNAASMVKASSGPIRIWQYYDNDSDNLASLTVGVAVAGYFNRANAAHGMELRTGDIIFAVNGATPVVTMFAVHSADNLGSPLPSGIGVSSNQVTVVPSGLTMNASTNTGY